MRICICPSSITEYIADICTKLTKCSRILLRYSVLLSTEHDDINRAIYVYNTESSIRCNKKKQCLGMPSVNESRMDKINFKYNLFMAYQKLKTV